MYMPTWAPYITCTAKSTETRSAPRSKAQVQAQMRKADEESISRQGELQ